MHDDNKSLTDNVSFLLSNIASALEIMSVKEVNKAVIQILSKRKDNGQEINYILKIVSAEYKIQISDLKSKNVRGINGQISEAKHIAYCLLHYTVGLSIRKIANNVFDCWPSSIQIGIARLKSINPKVNSDCVFQEKYDQLRTQFIQNKILKHNE